MTGKLHLIAAISYKHNPFLFKEEEIYALLFVRRAGRQNCNHSMQQQVFPELIAIQSKGNLSAFRELILQFFENL